MSNSGCWYAEAYGENLKVVIKSQQVIRLAEDIKAVFSSKDYASHCLYKGTKKRLLFYSVKVLHLRIIQL